MNVIMIVVTENNLVMTVHAQYNPEQTLSRSREAKYMNMMNIPSTDISFFSQQDVRMMQSFSWLIELACFSIYHFGPEQVILTILGRLP